MITWTSTDANGVRHGGLVFHYDAPELPCLAHGKARFWNADDQCVITVYGTDNGQERYLGEVLVAGNVSDDVLTRAAMAHARTALHTEEVYL